MQTKTQIQFISKSEAARTLRSLPNADTGHMFYCLGSYCWGRSQSAAEAAKQARINGGPGKYVLHLCNDTAEVDQVDGTLWHNAAKSRLNLMHFLQ